MSDSVNDYGLGAENTQHDEDEVLAAPDPFGEEPNPLAHGLGDQDVEGEAPVVEGRRHRSRQAHGLGEGGTVDEPLAGPGVEPDPLVHGLESADEEDYPPPR